MAWFVDIAMAVCFDLTGMPRCTAVLSQARTGAFLQMARHTRPSAPNA